MQLEKNVVQEKKKSKKRKPRDGCIEVRRLTPRLVETHRRQAYVALNGGVRPEEHEEEL